MENQLTKEMHNLLATLDLLELSYSLRIIDGKSNGQAQKGTWTVKCFTEIKRLVMCYSSSTEWCLEIDKLGTSTSLNVHFRDSK